MKTELTSHERDVACYRSALRDASSTKDEKELEVLEKAIDELATIIGHDVAMPILEEEIARQQAARREAEAERDELLAKMEALMKKDLERFLRRICGADKAATSGLSETEVGLAKGQALCNFLLGEDDENTNES